MSLIDRFFSRNKEQRGYESTEFTNPLLGTLNISTLGNYTNSKALKIGAVYRAVNLISDSIAVLEFNNFIYKDNWKYKQYNNLYNILNVQPNSLMGAYTFKKLIVQQILLKGNSYILIIRNKQGEITELQILNPDAMEVIIENNTIKYRYNNSRTFENSDIIHIMNYSETGIKGISTLEYASLSLGISYNSEEFASNFFSGGANFAGLLKPKSNISINDTKAKEIKDRFINASNINIQGVQSNSVVILDNGWEFEPLKLNAKEAQLVENRKFNILAISQFFGVPLSKLFAENSSYSSSEFSQIDFLNSTLLPIIEKIENEFYRKLFTKIEYDFTELKFDVSNLIRLDATTQASYFSQLYNMGAITTNEIREKINASNPLKGGNQAFIQVNLQKLDEPLVNNNQNLDNKLKQDE